MENALIGLITKPIIGLISKLYKYTSVQLKNKILTSRH